MLEIKKSTTLLVTITMMFALTSSLANASGYVTIANIKEETKNGWHETYTYSGQEILVDVDIKVPDVDAVPIVRIRQVGDVQPSDLPPYANITPIENAGFEYTVESKEGVMFLQKNGKFGHDRSVGNDIQAESSPLKPQEALDFIYERLAPYVESAGGFGLQIEYMGVYSRVYALIDSDKKGDLLDYNKPETQMGFYDIDFAQVFHGIPFIKKDSLFDVTVKSEPAPPFIGRIGGWVGSKNDYSLSFVPAIEDGILADDIPMVTFETVKHEFERLIESGYIRDVYRVRLGYILMYNPADLENTYLLIPAWELNGVIVQNPKDPTPAPLFDDPKQQMSSGGLATYVNAQTGKAYHPKDNTPTRYHGVFTTWDEVK